MRRLAPVLLIAALAIASDARALPPQQVCELAGTWDGRATDDGGTRWTFPIVFRQSGSRIDGTITWTGSNGSHGTESVTGTFDCASRALDFHTVTVEGEHLVSAQYRATVAPDARSLSGRWGGPGVPARFTAHRR